MMKIEKVIENVRGAFDAWEWECGIGDDWSEEHEARDIAISALEKQIPKSPRVRGLLFYSYHMYGNCPCCKGQVEESWRFCPWCGQALNWGYDDD